MGMKRMDKYILGNFIGPFAASFSTTLVILVIQFLSRYQEDILGKGFPAEVLIELFGYASASLVLLALPMGLLMAGLMTMGNLGERLELTALLSAGVPFTRVLAPLLISGGIALLLSGWLAWYLIPKANLKLYSLLYDMEHAKPALALKPGFFNRWIDGYAIRVGQIRGDKNLREVLIYEYAQDGSIERTILADSGEFFVEKEWLFLRFTLYNGCQYEMKSKPQQPPAWSQSCFERLDLRLDISGLGLRRSDEKLFAGHQYMLPIGELRQTVDSLRKLCHSVETEIYDVLRHSFPPPASSFSKDTLSLPKAGMVETENLLRRDRSLAEYYAQRLRQSYETYWRYELEWWYKFAYPVATVVFLVLGATLGGVIRKGGLGMPLVVSTMLFILFYILNAQGKKLAREGVMVPWVGAFLPLIVIAPIVVYLLLLVTTEARWLYMDFWKRKWREWRASS
ncbi:MAG: LptF/LptG family permease [Bacteroidia bacterium]|nr:LptF/LptG family permease [Bacteroidia bacterium]MCX7764601.1 LptF/LptG family permease [Bacteroidia bacterium]MDW8056836.1 LptF/LptG family permease [Bacteroidia bacterium]